MKGKWAWILGWLAVLGGAAFLRFDGLAERPFHFDEATGARITADRLDADYQFNPVHNHGPLLSAAAAPLCRLLGEDSWSELSKAGLRSLTTLAGTLLVLTPLMWRRRFGNLAALGAGVLLATSPILVYYSRTFIHEMLLTLFGVAFVVLVTRRRTLWIAGLCLGAMFATKEAFAISVMAWAGAGLLLAPRRLFSEIRRPEIRQQWLKPLLLALAAAGTISILFYSDFFTRPSGLIDAVRTFFIYEVEDGHDKPFAYYLEMLLYPTKAGITWTELPVGLLALFALSLSWRRGLSTERSLTIRFLALSILFHLLIYSLIAYKTPWLMCLPWAQACLLAGLLPAALPKTLRKPWSILAVLAFVVATFWQVRTSRFATGRFANDSRNPYAYAPTSRNVEGLERWLGLLADGQAPGTLEPIAVVGTYYWPLPWYLREFDRVGYWTQPQDAPTDCPVILVMAEHDPGMRPRLEESHVFFPRTLRSNVVVMLYLRKDLWNQWIESE